MTDADQLKKRGHLQVAAGRVSPLSISGEMRSSVMQRLTAFHHVRAQFEHAINEYSLALKVVQSGQEEARLLCNRSAAFAR